MDLCPHGDGTITDAPTYQECRSDCIHWVFSPTPPERPSMGTEDAGSKIKLAFGGAGLLALFVAGVVY